MPNVMKKNPVLKHRTMNSQTEHPSTKHYHYKSLTTRDLASTNYY